VEVEFRCPDRRSKTLDAIDKAVVKQFKDDPNWTRWNLVNLTGI
jgi:endonuclease III